MASKVRIMFQTFAVIIGLIAICVALLSVRIFFGKRFVHTHIEGNRDMHERGIHCVMHMDKEERRSKKTTVRE